MKTYSHFLIVITIMFGVFLPTHFKSQAEWETGGNTLNSTEYLGGDAGSTVPVEFQHHGDDADSRFNWYTHNGVSVGMRMTLTRLGWWGLNTSSPSSLFHVDNGTLLGTGTTGTNPDLGAGTRLMWIPSDQAFRAGLVSGTQWDGTNVGDYSIAFGWDNISSGNGTFTTGYSNTASGRQKTAD